MNNDTKKEGGGWVVVVSGLWERTNERDYTESRKTKNVTDLTVGGKISSRKKQGQSFLLLLILFMI